jgi:hypothetical protein
MNKKDFIKAIYNICDDDEIVVRLKQPGAGPIPSTKVTSVSHGSDWDNGKILITTETPVVTQEHLDRIQKYARDFEKLLYLYAMENNLEYMGWPLMGSAMCPKGSAVRNFKELMKKHIDDYLNPKGKK